MASIQELRAFLAKSVDATASIADSSGSISIAVADLKAAIGSMREWVYPVGDTTNLLYPPPGWTRSNWIGARYLLSGKYQYHTGDDLGLPGDSDVGIPVRSIHDGVVVFAGLGAGTWGNLVVIRHAISDTEFVCSRVAHMLHISVKTGDRILAGDVVGALGHTGGGAFSPHLHFDITKTNDDILIQNPQHWAGVNEAEVWAHYTDPGVYLKGKIAPPAPPPPDTAEWYRVNSLTGLNVRTEPRATASRIVTLPNNTQVKVAGEIKNGSYTWGQVVSCPTFPQAVNGYLARDFLVKDTPPVPPPSTTRKYHVGHHITDGAGIPSFILDHVQRMVSQGTPVPALTIINQDPLSFIAASPTTHIIWRSVLGHNDPPPNAGGVWMTGRAWFEKYRASYEPVWNRIRGAGYKTENLYAQWANEWWMGNQTSLDDAKRYADFYLDLIETAYTVGIRSTWGDFAFGNVNDGRVTSEPNHISAMKDLFELVSLRAKGGVILPLNYHAYGDENDPYNIVKNASFWALRWVNWLRSYPNVRFIGGESGIPDVNNTRFLSVENTMQMIRDIDRMTNQAITDNTIKAHQVLGYCWWTLGNDPKWTQFNYQPALAEIERYYKESVS